MGSEVSILALIGVVILPEAMAFVHSRSI